MNHQPFRDWLLSEEKLSTDQTQALQDHLLSCDSCCQIKASWLKVESAFDKSPEYSPAPGFTSRWKAHLSEYQCAKQKRRVWIMIGFTALIVTSLLSLLVTLMWSLLQAPGPFMAALFNPFLTLVPFYLTIQDIFSSFTGSTPIYTFIGMFFLVGMVSFFSVLWLSTYRKISMARRFI